ncbi:hypothetical protein SDRG_08654 [Saprolegnia diclina VS20]|uniref:Uncharacterized protein n=1 Tax=Saprolegnia diclina (strain VS20) TaxID=1156394 RepID=T0QJR7_SAPDV|nr:hypothetical protein SDRG_08654 [Saprolegnia diclina VS20]EQC33975.1 hypothetical protein SDRG_08654 [Saprolegnia diclina VS20]|eukprot:XP_008612770.1 hypothetical protein SDRG_08654 [Saprolegnia diclina VS20]
MPSWPRVVGTAHRCLALAAALYVAISALRNAAACNAVRLGAFEAPKLANVYTSGLVLAFLLDIAANSTTSLPRAPILYLNEGAQAAPYTIRTDSCMSYLDGSDLLYNASVALPLVASILPSTGYLVVDCSYTGRVLGDTTAFKVYVIDEHTVTTVYVQTMGLRRPKAPWQTSCATATVLSAPLASLSLLESNVSSYRSFVSLGFPYEVNSNFQEVLLDPITAFVGSWSATVIATSERIVVAGTEGIYRISPTVQASMDSYVWLLPASPVDFIQATQYTQVGHAIDKSFAWARCLLSATFGLHLLWYLALSVVIAWQRYQTHSYLWIPDLYACVLLRARQYTLLWLCISAIDRGWELLEYAIATGNAQQGWSATFVLPDMVFGDLLVVYLSLLDAVASVAHARLHLHVAVVLFLVGFVRQAELLVAVDLERAAASALLRANYLANVQVVAPPTSMTLWTVHMYPTTPTALLVASYAWFFVAIVVGCCYIAAQRLYERCRRSKTGGAVEPSSRTASLAPAIAIKRASIVPSLSAVCEASHETGTSRRGPTCASLALASQPQPLSWATVLEAAVPSAARNLVGLVAPTTDQIGSELSPSELWSHGFVLLRRSYLVSIHDVGWLALNVLCGRPVARVYGYHLHACTCGLELVDVLRWSQLLELHLDAPRPRDPQF